LFRQDYALNALKLQLGAEHPFIVELARKNGLNAAAKAGSTKTTAAELFPFNKAQ